MLKIEAKQRIEKLKKVINHHRYLCHVLDKQEISEAALDSLKKELFDLEQKFPDLITKDSPTQRIAGEPLAQFKKVKHREPMFSLNDGFSETDILDWRERISKLMAKKQVNSLDFFAECKIDGLNVSLIYQKGVLQRGATRGDGKIGEDVTGNLKTIGSIPLKLEIPIDCEVGGEVFINKDDFVKLNKNQEKKGEKPYANPRNTAAGAIRQLDPKIAAERHLNFLAWRLSGFETQEKEYQLLKSLGFKPAPGKHCRSIDEVFAYYYKIKEQREKLPYQIDGVVVSVNNNQLFKELGVAGKSPRASIAFKFPMKESTTKVRGIKLQIGRTGSITPVAVLEPVEIGGATISRATLHNEDEIKRLGLKIGDTVIVGRAGDVIPKVIKVLKDLRIGKERSFSMPKKCPICHSLLQKAENEVVWRCPNPDCDLRKRQVFYHFVSKPTFDIDGLGPKIIDQLLEQGLITDRADIFTLKQGDLIPLERFAQKSASNLIKAINQKKRISLPRFIFSLGIRGVGERTALLLAKRLNFKFKILNFKIFIEKTQMLSLQDLEQIIDIGPINALNIYNWFHNRENIQFLEHLEAVGVKLANDFNKEPQSSGFKNKTFVLTGVLGSLTREKAKEKIRQRGGDVFGSVSKNTSFLVAGKDPGSKFDKARNLGIKILSEKEFLKML